MTPSFPTFFIASAIILPIVSSLFALIVPTWAIISPETGLENLSSSPLSRSPSLLILPQTSSTAFSMPRLSAIGLAPCDGLDAFTINHLRENGGGGGAVAGDIGGLAGDFADHLRAHVLERVFEFDFFAITTLRPLGPSVTFTASARRLTPRRIACRDSSPCTICFAIILFSS